MRALGIALLLAATVAQAQTALPTDVPVAFNLENGSTVVTQEMLDINPELVESGFTVGYEIKLVPGLYYNRAAEQNVNAAIARMQERIVGLAAENEALKSSVDTIAADPPTNWNTILVVGGVGLGLGLVAGLVAGLAL